MPQNLISVITARKMLRRGCQSYLAVVRNVEADKGAVNRVPVVCEFPDVFPEEFPGLMTCLISFKELDAFRRLT